MHDLKAPNGNSDPGFEIERGVISFFWDGYEYTISMNGIERPEDLMKWLIHFGKKRSPGMTPIAVAMLIEEVAIQKGWKLWK